MSATKTKIKKSHYEIKISLFMKCTRPLNSRRNLMKHYRPLDLGHQLALAFYTSLRRQFLFLSATAFSSKTLGKTQVQVAELRRRWCSVSHIVRGIAMPPNPTNTGSSRPLVKDPPFSVFILFMLLITDLKQLTFLIPIDSERLRFAYSKAVSV